MTIHSRESLPFGDLLKAFRTRQHLTQQQLASALGMHRHAIVRWEQGDVLPATRGLVLELARHLHLDEGEIRRLLEASLTALAPYWGVPLPRNPCFTGREDMLEALHQQLGIDQAIALTHSTAVSGLGGVGKTQIALEYAYRHALEYSAVFWIGAETEEQIVSSLLRIAELLHLPECHAPEQQHVVAALHRWLTTHSQWLLIWDNLEDLDLLPRYLPPARGGAILLTTRAQALGTLARGLALLPMEPEEGLLFLLRRAKILEPDATSEQVRHFAVRVPGEYAAATDLVEVLGGLPLALDQAGAYIEETGCRLADYLGAYGTQRTRFLARRGTPASDHPQSVATTFWLLWQRVQREQPAAADLLAVCAVLAAEAIPDVVFVAGAAHLGPDLRALATDGTLFDHVIAVLHRLSLVQRQAATRTLSLHRLVQVVLREAMSAEEQTIWRRRVTAALNAAFPEAAPATWEHSAGLLPHVLTVASATPEGTADGDLAAVLRKAADYLSERAGYAQAEPLYQRALRIGTQVWGPDQPELASALWGVAYLYFQQGHYQHAAPLFEQALRIREQALGPTHPAVAAALRGLGMLCWMQDDYARAEQYYQRAAAILDGTREPAPLEEARLLNARAVLARQQGQAEVAERWFLRALCLQEQVGGPEHLEVAYPLTNLAILYAEQGQEAEAEPLYQRARSLLEHAWGLEHPVLATALQGLADLWARQGKEAEAEPLYQRVCSILEGTLGPDYPDLAYPLQGLAALYAKAGQDARATALYQRALRLCEGSLGPEHPRVVPALIGLARLASARGEYQAAEARYLRALQIQDQVVGSEHPETARVLAGLAGLYAAWGRDAQAEPLLCRACAILKARLGPAHPETVNFARDYQGLLEHKRTATEMRNGASPTHIRRLPNGPGHRRTPLGTLAEGRSTTSRLEDDPLGAFLVCCCEVHPWAWSRAGDLWSAYECWVATHQERFPLSRRTFIAQLKAHGCRPDRTKTARIWRGIALVQQRAMTQGDGR